MKAKNKEEYIDKLTRKFAATISHVEQMKALAHAGHTPGPWKNENESIKDSQGWIVALLAKRANKGITEANARLIAAAPDLLRELKYAQETLYADYNEEPGSGRFQCIDDAIAKAEGENK